MANIDIKFGNSLISVSLKTMGTVKQLSFGFCDKDGDKLNQIYVDKNGNTVPRDKMFRIFNIHSNSYVMSQEDYSEIENSYDETINIVEFVPSRSVPDVQILKSYYAIPASGCERNYKALFEALSKRKVAAVCTQKSCIRSDIIVIKPYGKGLIVNYMYYASEAAIFNIDLSALDVSQKDIDIAEEIIDSMVVSSYAPQKFIDEVFSDVAKSLSDNQSKYRIIPISKANKGAK